MTTYSDIVGLRVVRSFMAKPVAPEDVDAILEAGRWTGSSKNRQDWVFILIDDASDRQNLAAAGSFTAPVLAAPLAVALVRMPGGNDFDIGRAAQNMMLAAAARGVASCPVTLHREDRAHTVLGLDSDEHCRYAIAFGYPDTPAEEAARRERRSQGWGGRKDLSDLVRRSRGADIQ